MAEFRLERFKYTWKGEWSGGVAYRRDDVVRVNGKSYVCIIGHVASSAFRTDLDAILPGSVPPQPQPKWVVMTNGFSFVGDWETSTDYNLGDIVLYNGSLWLCSVNHSSTTFAEAVDNWSAFTITTSFVGEWTSGDSYSVGSVVKYNGNLHKCIVTHTAGSILEDNAADWEMYKEGVEWQDQWQPSTEYRVNDFVKYGGTIFRCIETHTSDSDSLDDTKFEVEVFGSQYDGTWDSETYYNIGDIVRHEGFMYYAVNNNTDSKPFIDSETGSLDWILLARNMNFVGSWTVDSLYKTGDVVRRGGNLYLALRDIGGVYDELGDFVSGELIDGSTLDYLDPETWELMVPGKAWKGNWTTSTVYSVGDIVYFKGSAYLANTEHESAVLNYPGDNGNGYYYWDILVEAGRQAALSQKGDLLTYGLSREFDDDGSTVFDGSTLGDSRLGIGESEQLLSVTEDLDLYWRNITEDADSVFVATNGIDAEGRGTYQKPFKTIKYATTYVEDNYEPLAPVIIRVSAGKFEEVSPISVPAGCAINGDELRSTTVLANSPKAEYQNDYQYVEAYLTYLTSILFDIATGTEITPQTGNTVTQITEIVDPVTFIDSYPSTDLDGVNQVVSLLDEFKNYVEFNIGSGVSNPTVSGSNTLGLSNIAAAGEALFINREFLQQELYSYLINTYPDVTFTENRVKNDIWYLIRALRRDTKYSGNYETINVARRYANSVKGSQLENLFLLRDATGLRDMTTGGLQGVLNPPGVFELYQKPTGGALVSLDPVWGPEDDRMWINTRSPYIQGVTNTGSGCTGMKVDGALHANGNKSMVANDFTQVLSDGIGMWITNNARAELVSVFTYYCQIGYFAEDGGIIRSANGNNSYGKYGSIADGIDEDETPQIVAAFNRNNEAQVAEAFAGGATDQIKIFEFLNAGEEYTTATASIVGAGSNAEVEFNDFRDGGLFESRLISPDGSSAENGAGYLRRQGNAQELADASSTIVLAATDVTQFLSEIDGMRIIITDGLGVGQYGYIDDFTFATKTATVRRDSDGELGWDHIIPGTPLEPSFDLTTRYRIEPRIEYSHPGFSDTTSILFTNRTYVDAAYGNITESYNGVSGGGNVIWRDDNESRITVSSVISNISMQFNASIIQNLTVPFDIKGRTTETTATITAITANTGDIIEVDVSGNGSSFQVGEEIDLILTAGTGDTFDGAAIPAVFNIVRQGTEYNVTVANDGSGYSVNDKITLLGTALGGATPDNDLTITVTEVSDDSTSSILAFTTAGIGRGGRYVSLTNSENARFSDDGVDWTEITLPFVGSYNTLISGNNRFLALSSGDSRLASTLNGVTWSEVSLPLEAAWSDGVYGNDKFVIVATDTDIVASSADGVTWTTGSIPDDTDGAPDSTESQWKSITYGNGKYVAVSANDLATASSTDGVTWTRHDSALTDFGAETIVNISYGNNRFVVVTEEGSTAFSFDGISWIQGGDIISASLDIVDVKYDQGIFFAIGNNAGGSTTTCATSEFGLTWDIRSLSVAKQWSALTYGNGTWTLIASAASTDAVATVRTGARAKARAEIDTGSMQYIKILDPGSGYSESNLPVITITDPNPTFEVLTESRIGNGVIAQPDFINRGSGYRSSTSTITITGDGYADIIPIENKLTVSGVKSIPGPGVQLKIAGIEDPDSLIPGELAVFSGVTVIDLGDDGTGNETRLVEFQISPRLSVEYVIEHGAEITMRERFSQCRISGHDFLDIGTGNFEQTNYPAIYAGGSFFTAAPENEVFETNGGRVFYVSTDQDGNFRTGELFSVQQATGVVTISAQFFNLDGLSELSLGGVRLGGSGTVINEFSTDPTFAADSNNVIPTQRAIVTFLSDRLSVGGESLEVNRLQAGRVILGGEADEINTATDQYLLIPPSVVFDGTYEANDGEGNITTEQTNVSGTIVSQMLYFKGFDESMQ